MLSKLFKWIENIWNLRKIFDKLEDYVEYKEREEQHNAK